MLVGIRLNRKGWIAWEGEDRMKIGLPQRGPIDNTALSRRLRSSSRPSGMFDPTCRPDGQLREEQLTAPPGDDRMGPIHPRLWGLICGKAPRGLSEFTVRYKSL